MHQNMLLISQAANDVQWHDFPGSLSSMCRLAFGIESTYLKAAI